MRSRWPVYALLCFAILGTLAAAVLIAGPILWWANELSEKSAAQLILGGILLLFSSVLAWLKIDRLNSEPKYLAPWLWVKVAQRSALYYPKDEIERRWIAELAKIEVREAALAFLSECAAQEEWNKIIADSSNDLESFLNSVKIKDRAEFYQKFPNARIRRANLEEKIAYYKAARQRQSKRLKEKKNYFHLLWDMYKALEIKIEPIPIEKYQNVLKQCDDFVAVWREKAMSQVRAEKAQIDQSPV